MTFRSIFLPVIAIIALTMPSCKIQEQIRSYNRMISPASNGNVSLTLSRMDSVQTFRNPLVNLKYQKTKKKYAARFSNDTENVKMPCKNEVINEICSIYQNYWRIKLLNASIDCDSILYSKLSHYLVDNELTERNIDELSKTIKDDSELTKVIEREGVYCKFLRLNGIQDLLIWDEQSVSKYSIELPENSIDINVIFIENYVLQGAANYATFGHSQIGGWASNSDSSLFCNKGAYKLRSEKFQYSYLKHESIHFIDIKDYPNLESADLEYRAKLIELIYCTEKTIYKRLDEFILGASNETRTNSHAYANHHLICQLSKEIFATELEIDISKWKSIPPEEINKTSVKLFMKGALLLKANPGLNRIIEDVYNVG